MKRPIMIGIIISCNLNFLNEQLPKILISIESSKNMIKIAYKTVLNDTLSNLNLQRYS